MRTLDVLLGTEVNEIFFPWAAVNTGELSEYWLVEIRTQRVRQPLGWIDGRLDDLGRIEDSRNPYPADLSPALEAVCLYPWTERLVKRLGAILGDTDAARKATENHLRKIYAIRSALVHGGRFKEDLHVGYLTLARAFARSAAVWFLSCHRAIREAQPAQLHLTSADFRLRDDILTLLDMDDEERRRMARLLAGLPEAFPRVPLLLSATEPGSFFD